MGELFDADAPYLKLLPPEEQERVRRRREELELRYRLNRELEERIRRALEAAKALPPAELEKTLKEIAVLREVGFKALQEELDRLDQEIGRTLLLQMQVILTTPEIGPEKLKKLALRLWRFTEAESAAFDDPRLWQRIYERASAELPAAMKQWPLEHVRKNLANTLGNIAAEEAADLAAGPLPETPNPLLQPLAAFASGAPAFGAVKAILNKAGWEPDEDGFPRFVTTFKGRKVQAELAYHIILPYNPSTETVILAQKELAYEMLRSMGPDTVWLHMLLLAYTARVQKGEKCVIPRQAVYKALGLEHRTDLTRREKDQRCFEEIRRLQSIGLSILQLRLNGKDVSYERRRGYMWHLATREFGQVRLEEERGRFVQRFEDWQLLAAPGHWADLFLFGEPLRQVGWLAQDMFEKIDRRRSTWAIALAVMLTFYGRFDPKARISLTMAQIIEFAGGDLAPTDRGARYEIRMQVLNAIAEQEKWGWTVDRSDWPDWLRRKTDMDLDKADEMVTGDGSEAAPGSARIPAGSWDIFLAVTTHFEPPQELQALNMRAAGIKALPPGTPQQKTGPKGKSTSKPKAHRFKASDLRELRLRMNMTQDQMAEYLGVSQNMVSLMERGKRAISAEVQKRLAILAGEL